MSNDIISCVFLYKINIEVNKKINGTVTVLPLAVEVLQPVEFFNPFFFASLSSEAYCSSLIWYFFPSSQLFDNFHTFYITYYSFNMALFSFH